MNIPLDQFCGSPCPTNFSTNLNIFSANLSRISFAKIVHLKTRLRERLVGPVDDGVVGSQVDTLQDVLLCSLVLHVVIIPDDRNNDGYDFDMSTSYLPLKFIWVLSCM